MADRSRLRVGVVGVGGIAQMMHLPTLVERADLFELVALADLDSEALAAVGARYGVGPAHLHSDAAALVAEPDLDAVLLCASGSHREAALAALAADRHLFIEKPLGYGPTESEQIARAAEASSRAVMVGYHKRYDPAFERARDAVRTLGDLRHVQVTVLHPDDAAYRRHHELLPRRPAAGPFGCPADRPIGRRPTGTGGVPEASERRTAELVAAGPLAPLVDDIAGRAAPIARRVAGFICYQSLIHDLNLVRAVLGEPEKVLSWTAWRGGLAQSSLTRFGGDVCVGATWVSVPELRNYEETIKFVGSRGRVTLVFPSPYLRHVPTPLAVERMDGDVLVVENQTVSYDEAFRRELCAFFDCAVNGREVPTSVSDALGDARWIQAMLAVGDSALT